MKTRFLFAFMAVLAFSITACGGGGGDDLSSLRAEAYDLAIDAIEEEVGGDLEFPEMPPFDQFDISRDSADGLPKETVYKHDALDMYIMWNSDKAHPETDLGVGINGHYKSDGQDWDFSVLVQRQKQNQKLAVDPTMTYTSQNRKRRKTR